MHHTCHKHHGRGKHGGGRGEFGRLHKGCRPHGRDLGKTMGQGLQTMGHEDNAPSKATAMSGATCPLCKNHCPLSDPGCPKGEVFAQANAR
nr:hypothetical protein [uncultured Desulfobulbus sp.]